MGAGKHQVEVKGKTEKWLDPNLAHVYIRVRSNYSFKSALKPIRKKHQNDPKLAKMLFTHSTLLTCKTRSQTSQLGVKRSGNPVVEEKQKAADIQRHVRRFD